MGSSSAVGMNLAPVNYWSTEFPFIDRMKSAGSWQSWNVPGIQVDANGMPLATANGPQSLYTMVALDPPSAGTNNVYELTYTGSMTVRVPGATIISSEPGKLVFKYTGTNMQQQIMISGLDAKSPVTEMHLVRQDQVALFKQGEIFNPAFLDKISDFDTLRFMDWMQTNASSIQNWDQRATMNSLSWATTSDNGGVPIEVMVALANKTHTNMWINIPTKATDDYVRKTMEYVRDHLDSSLKVSVEYSNEMWNWGFQQSRYAQAEAEKLWGAGVAGGWEQYYGYRASQVAAIANDTFGGPNSPRLENVLATQTAYTGLEKYIFAGIQRANLGDAGTLFDQYAVTTYFGAELSGQTAGDREIILGWARSGAAGLDAAFNELMNGGVLQTTGSLASLIPTYAYQAAVASKYGLDLVAYEGGIDLAAQKFAAKDQPDVMAFFARLEADPRMGDVYRKMMGDFAAAGGSLANIYSDARPLNAGGSYGTIQSIYDDSPAWNALVALQDQYESTITTLSEVVLAAAQKELTYSGGAAFKAMGNELNNVITGGSGKNTLNGGSGNDTLIGGLSDDSLDGGTGADTMSGKGGNDTYFVDNAGDNVIEGVAGGNDEVRTTLASYTLTPNVETLTYTGTGAFTGKGNDLDNVINGGNGGATLSGGAGNDTLIGGAGNDTLDGGTGTDTLKGGAGNDVYLTDSANDAVVEAANAGTDEVRTTAASYALSANVENLTFAGAGAFTGTGNDLANAIIGGSGANKLAGGAGNDVLVGGASNDVLDGGTGNDVMKGGAGNDTYIVDSAADTVSELAGQGTDEVRTTLTSYTLGANLESLTFIGTGAFTGRGNELANTLNAGDGGATLFGGDSNDTLNGGAGGDYLDGGTGGDKMSGAGGNDVYVVDNGGDIVIETANNGTDEVRASIGSYTLTANVENLVFTGNGNFVGGGNAGNNVITGSTTGTNRLFGMDGNDTLTGGAFADSLDGGTGADRMIGGRGDDGYIVDNVGDVVVENANEGTDTVYATVNYTLGANFENLRLSGTDPLSGAGNDAANTITGNAGANKLSGLGGNDYLYGGDGNDTLDGGDGSDFLQADNGDDSLLGGAGNDTLYGNAGNDMLTGGAGKDTLVGGAGADRFVFGNGDLAKLVGDSDTIADFTRTDGDKIDLSQLDAIAGTASNDAFKFLGAGAFTKHAGELRVDMSGFYAVVSGDTNGDGVADFVLSVSKGSGTLLASDFVL